jgi:hypothetical protein
VERFFATGVQIGILHSCLSNTLRGEQGIKILDEIRDNQFIGNMPEPYADYEIVIKKKTRTG